MVFKQLKRFELGRVQGQGEQKHVQGATAKLVEQGTRLAFNQLETQVGITAL